MGEEWPHSPRLPLSYAARSVTPVARPETARCPAVLLQVLLLQVLLLQILLLHIQYAVSILVGGMPCLCCEDG
jgi:hypothetical protein